MTVNWEQDGRNLARSIAEAVSAPVEESRLTDRLILFTFRPRNEDAASMSLIVSSDEVILEAGQGTRFELDPLAESATEVMALAFAIARGRLTERVHRRRIKELSRG